MVNSAVYKKISYQCSLWISALAVIIFYQLNHYCWPCPIVSYCIRTYAAIITYNYAQQWSLYKGYCTITWLYASHPNHWMKNRQWKYNTFSEGWTVLFTYFLRSRCIFQTAIIEIIHNLTGRSSRALTANPPSVEVWNVQITKATPIVVKFKNESITFC